MKTENRTGDDGDGDRECRHLERPGIFPSLGLYGLGPLSGQDLVSPDRRPWSFLVLLARTPSSIAEVRDFCRSFFLIGTRSLLTEVRGPFSVSCSDSVVNCGGPRVSVGPFPGRNSDSLDRGPRSFFGLSLGLRRQLRRSESFCRSFYWSELGLSWPKSAVFFRSFTQTPSSIAEVR